MATTGGPGAKSSGRAAQVQTARPWWLSSALPLRESGRWRGIESLLRACPLSPTPRHQGRGGLWGNRPQSGDTSRGFSVGHVPRSASCNRHLCHTSTRREPALCARPTNHRRMCGSARRWGLGQPQIDNAKPGRAKTLASRKLSRRAAAHLLGSAPAQHHGTHIVDRGGYHLPTILALKLGGTFRPAGSDGRQRCEGKNLLAGDGMELLKLFGAQQGCGFGQGLSPVATCGRTEHAQLCLDGLGFKARRMDPERFGPEPSALNGLHRAHRHRGNDGESFAGFGEVQFRHRPNG